MRANRMTAPLRRVLVDGSTQQLKSLAKPLALHQFDRWVNESLGHIYSIEVDDCNEVQLTDGNCIDWIPSASPNGQLVAFWSTRAGKKWEIFLMKPDGSDIQQLSRDPIIWSEGAGLCPFSWSPDSQKIIFSAPAGSKKAKIMEIDLKGNCKQLSGKDENYCYAPLWLNSQTLTELPRTRSLNVTTKSLSLN